MARASEAVKHKPRSRRPQYWTLDGRDGPADEIAAGPARAGPPVVRRGADTLAAASGVLAAAVAAAAALEANGRHGLHKPVAMRRRPPLSRMAVYG
eukprot:SAG11_NODE_17019_length_530_cov_23.296984_1_plen_96_part_00